jgi:hypothetical protein
MKKSNETITHAKETDVSMNKMEYEKMLPAITAVPDDTIVHISIPPIDLIAEAEELCRWAIQDVEELNKTDLSPDAIEQLECAAGALRYANSGYARMLKMKNQWQQESPEAYALRKKMIHTFMYAYRGHPEILEIVRNATKGLNRRKLVQHLENLSGIGKDHPEELKAVGFEMALLDRATVLSARMGDILGELKAGTKEENSTRKIRLQAYTLCKTLMGEIRMCGKFLFPRSHKRYVGYTSSYTRSKKHTAKEVAVPAAAEIREAA